MEVCHLDTILAHDKTIGDKERLNMPFLFIQENIMTNTL